VCVCVCACVYLCVCVCAVLALQPDQQGNPVSMTVPHVQLINPENQIVEVSVCVSPALRGTHRGRS